MRLRLLISLNLLLLVRWNVGAQLAPADDYFHNGAQLYISNSIPQAKEVVEMGRKLYPEDEKLKKLEELLKQQQNQQQQDQSQQNDQQKKSDEQKQQDQKDQPKPKDQSPDQKDKSDQKKPDEKKDSDQKKEEEKKPEDQKKDTGEKPKDEKPEGQPAQPVKPGQMTPEEAKRLLDAQKGQEQLLQLKPQEKPRNSSRPVKDW